MYVGYWYNYITLRTILYLIARTVCAVSRPTLANYRDEHLTKLVICVYIIDSRTTNVPIYKYSL